MQETDTEGSPRRPSHGDLGQLPLPRLHSQLGTARASSQHLSLLGGRHGRRAAGSLAGARHQLLWHAEWPQH